MNHIYTLAILFFLGSCGNAENRNDNSALTEATFEMNQVNKDVFIEVKNLRPNLDSAYLLINERMIENKVNNGKTTIDKNALNLGKNTVALVINKRGHNSNVDTICQPFFFSLMIGYSIKEKFNHNTKNFTQGLLIDGDKLYESTGLEGQSKIVKYTLNGKSLTVIDSIINNKEIFGEGIALYNNALFQLTWKNHIVYKYDKNTWKKTGAFRYPNEGWGLCTNSNYLIASDGSSFLYFINPSDFSISKKLEVTDANGSVKKMNELEFMDDIIVANIWETNKIVFISEHSGFIIGELDLSELSFENQNPDTYDAGTVLNGIAYAPRDRTFLVTGKLWYFIYKIKLDENYDYMISKNRRDK